MNISSEIIQKIHQSFAAQSFMTTVGARLTQVADGQVEICAPIHEDFRQQQGFGHAALVFALGDTAAGFAALTCMPPENEVVTAEIKINLISPAVGQSLIARGAVIKPGRRLVVVQSNVFAVQDDGSEKHVAVMMGTMVPVTT